MPTLRESIADRLLRTSEICGLVGAQRAIRPGEALTRDALERKQAGIDDYLRRHPEALAATEDHDGQ